MGFAAPVATVVAPEKILATDMDVVFGGCKGVHRPGMAGMVVVGNVVRMVASREGMSGSMLVRGIRSLLAILDTLVNCEKVWATTLAGVGTFAVV